MAWRAAGRSLPGQTVAEETGLEKEGTDFMQGQAGSEVVFPEKPTPAQLFQREPRF